MPLFDLTNPPQLKKLCTLYDVLSFAAHHFQSLLTVLPNFRQSFLHIGRLPEDTLTDEELDDAKTALLQVLDLCNRLDLHTSKKATQRLLDTDLRRKGYRVNDAMAEIESRIHDELEGQVFLRLDHPQYYQSAEWMGSEVLEKFPLIEGEALEAGACYALDRYTASVFHLMRILEYGLAAFATALSVPVTNPNWHHVLQECEKKIRTLRDHNPSWKQDEPFFNGAALEFRHFQRAVRNHAMHGRDSYTQSEAHTILSHVTSFMRHISQRLSQVPLP
ncbi:MAG: hypothetical protein ACRD8O_17370 [Bryobacteraceae bacterium]